MVLRPARSSRCQSLVKGDDLVGWDLIPDVWPEAGSPHKEIISGSKKRLVRMFLQQLSGIHAISHYRAVFFSHVNGEVHCMWPWAETWVCCCPSDSSSSNLATAGLKDLISLLPVWKDDLINLKVDRQNFFSVPSKFGLSEMLSVASACIWLHQVWRFRKMTGESRNFERALRPVLLNCARGHERFSTNRF